MSEEIIREWHFWLASIATGACMAFSYDLLRLFRRLIKHGRIAVDLEDLLYWIVWFCFSFALLYYGNNGVIRFAAVFGAAVGMLMYAATIGRFFIKVSYFVIDKTVGNLLRLFRKLLEPIKRGKRAAIRKIRLTCATIHHNIKIYHLQRQNKEGRKRSMAERKKNTKKTKRKTPEFLRNRNENRLGMLIAVFAILITTSVVGVHSISLKQKEKAYAAREQELLQLIAVEEARAKELEEFATYTKTKKYAEEVAKDKLGLVYENEIIFQEID